MQYVKSKTQTASWAIKQKEIRLRNNNNYQPIFQNFCLNKQKKFTLQLTHNNLILKYKKTDPVTQLDSPNFEYFFVLFRRPIRFFSVGVWLAEIDLFTWYTCCGNGPIGISYPAYKNKEFKNVPNS